MVDPLYSMEDAEMATEQFQPVAYDESFEPVKGVSARLVEAGHILGSAAVVLDIREGSRQTRLWFSGDIGRYKLPLLRDPVLPAETDALIMECTYGDKPHRDPEVSYLEFRDVVRRTIERGGKVVVPAFSVGRTQELVFFLNRMIQEKQLPPIPVFVDSPMAINATEIYKKYPQCYDEETREFVESGQHPALMFPGLKYTRPVEESKAINAMDEPMVIISASGMAEAGRILHHLIHNISDPKNTICIVSWMAPNTLGRRLAERQKKVRIFGEEVLVRAEIATIGGLSAHGGQDMLLEYAESANRNGLKNLFLVHGEERAAGALLEQLRARGIRQASYPERGEVVEL
jgi:metallo-beta-lactamase family protein